MWAYFFALQKKLVIARRSRSNPESEHRLNGLPRRCTPRKDKIRKIVDFSNPCEKKGHKRSHLKFVLFMTYSDNNFSSIIRVKYNFFVNIGE